MVTNESLADRFTRLLTEQRRKLRDIARDTGININTLSLIKNGLSPNPHQETVDAIAAQLGVSPYYLRYGKEQETRPIEDLAALKGWFGGEVLNRIEGVIRAEVKAQLGDAVEAEITRLILSGELEARIAGQGAQRLRQSQESGEDRQQPSSKPFPGESRRASRGRKSA